MNSSEVMNKTNSTIGSPIEDKPPNEDQLTLNFDQNIDISA